MPCYTKKNVNKAVCDFGLMYNQLFNSCEDMDKYACNIWSQCCYWKWSTGAIVGFVIAGLAGLFCIVFMILYIRKYYVK